MVLKQALTSFQNNPKIAVVPVLLDLGAILLVFLILASVFPGIVDVDLSQDSFHVGLAFPSIPPSVSDVLEGEWVITGVDEGALVDWAMYRVQEPADALPYIPPLIGLILVGVALGVFFEAGFLGSLKDGYRQHKQITPVFFIENAKKYFWNLLKYRLLILGVIVALFLLVILFFYAVSRSADPFAFLNLLPFLRVIALLLLLGAIVFAFFLIFVPYAIVDENLPLFKAMFASFDAVKSAIGKVILHLLALTGIFLGVSIVINGVALLSVFIAIILYAPAGCFGIYTLYLLFCRIREERRRVKEETKRLLEDSHDPGSTVETDSTT